METAQILQTLLALAFVLGLLLTTLWLIKYCQQKGLSCSFQKAFSGKSKIKIAEQRRLDAKSSVLLLQYEDKEEFLILLGSQNNIVLRQTELKKESISK